MYALSFKKTMVVVSIDSAYEDFLHPPRFVQPVGFPSLYSSKIRSWISTSFRGWSAIGNMVMSLGNCSGQELILSLSQSSPLLSVDGCGNFPLGVSRSLDFSLCILEVLSSALGWTGILISKAEKTQATSWAFVPETFKFLSRQKIFNAFTCRFWIWWNESSSELISVDNRVSRKRRKLLKSLIVKIWMPYEKAKRNDA